jgi:hypothetical protein
VEGIRLVRRICISLLLASSCGLLAWFVFNPVKKAAGRDEDLSQSAAQQFSKKLAELASPRKDRSSTTVEFSQKEVDSYLHYELSQFFPKGLHDVRIKLLQDSLSANARINFDQLQSGENSVKNSLLGVLLQGEHSLEVLGKLSAQNKQGSYEILALRLDQREVPKPLVDLLIAKLVVPKYPNAKPNTPFDLPYEITRIDINEGKVVVHRGG